MDENGFVRHSNTSLRSDPVSDFHSHPEDADQRSVDVYVSYIAHDVRYASFLAAELWRRGLRAVTDTLTQHVSIVDQARCVVIMLSDAYRKSLRKIDELNLSLTRLRSRRPVYFVAVETMSPTDTPTYIRLTRCAVCLADEFWNEALVANHVTEFSGDVITISQKVESKHGRLESAEVLALMKTACDVEHICRSDRLVIQSVFQ